MDTIYRKLSDQLLTLHCRRCDAEARQKILAILENKRFVCPSCASLNDVDTAALEEKISGARARRKAQQAPPSSGNCGP